MRIYRHYKSGNLYAANLRDSVTHEATITLMTTYTALATQTTYCRPTTEFLEVVTLADGKKVQRFEDVTDQLCKFGKEILTATLVNDASTNQNQQG